MPTPTNIMRVPVKLKNIETLFFLNDKKNSKDFSVSMKSFTFGSGP